MCLSFEKMSWHEMNAFVYIHTLALNFKQQCSATDFITTFEQIKRPTDDMRGIRLNNIFIQASASTSG